MTNTTEFDALGILRILSNLYDKRNKRTPYHGEMPSNFKPLTYLDDEEFKSAMDFLHKNRYIPKPKDNRIGQKIADQGKTYLKEMLEIRQINNIEAERILKDLVTSSPTGKDELHQTYLMAKYNLELPNYEEACQELIDLGFIIERNKTHDTPHYSSIQATREGRNAFRNNFKIINAQVTINKYGDELQDSIKISDSTVVETAIKNTKTSIVNSDKSDTHWMKNETSPQQAAGYPPAI